MWPALSPLPAPASCAASQPRANSRIGPVSASAAAGIQRLEKLGGVALALDGDAQGMALWRLQCCERSCAASDGTMAFPQRTARPFVQRRELHEALFLRRGPPAMLQQPALHRQQPRARPPLLERGTHGK